MARLQNLNPGRGTPIHICYIYVLYICTRQSGRNAVQWNLYYVNYLARQIILSELVAMNRDIDPCPDLQGIVEKYTVHNLVPGTRYQQDTVSLCTLVSSFSKGKYRSRL